MIDIFDFLYSVLKPELFKDIFKVCLTDNGSEFSNPLALEFDSSQKRRTHIFTAMQVLLIKRDLPKETTNLSAFYSQRNGYRKLFPR